MIPLTIVDNFWENPYKLREFALQQEYLDNGSEVGYAGERTARLHDLNNNITHVFFKKVLSLFFDVNKESVDYEVTCEFQIISEKFEDGWCHTDSGRDIAGILYLTPNAPKNSGTSICKLKKNVDLNKLNHSLKNKFYTAAKIGDEDNMNLYRKTREEHNSKFETTVEISNVFNRLVVYNSKEWHKANYFFGKDKYDSRMTLVFFSKIDTKKCYLPIARSRLMY